MLIIQQTGRYHQKRKKEREKRKNTCHFIVPTLPITTKETLSLASPQLPISFIHLPSCLVFSLPIPEPVPLYIHTYNYSTPYYTQGFITYSSDHVTSLRRLKVKVKRKEKKRPALPATRAHNQIPGSPEKKKKKQKRI